MNTLPHPWNRSLRHQEIDALPILADWFGEQGMNSQEEFTRLLHRAMDDGPAYYDIQFTSPERSSELVRASMRWQGRTHTCLTNWRARNAYYYAPNNYTRHATYSPRWTIASVWPHAYHRFVGFVEHMELLLARDLLGQRAAEANERFGVGWGKPWTHHTPTLIYLMPHEHLDFWNRVIDYLEGKTEERP